MSRRLVRVVLLLMCSLGIVSGVAAPPAHAQTLDAAPRGPRFLAAWITPAAPVDAHSVAELRRRVTLDLSGASVDDALKELVRQADLNISYTPQLLPAGKRLSLQVRGITVAAALTEVLLDTGLDVAVGRTGRLALVPAAERVRVQTGRVVGQVTDAKTGAGVAGVEVTLEGTRGRVVTGEDGRYRLADIAPGSYTLLVKRLGYAPARQSVTVVEGQEVTVDLALEPRPTPLDEVVVTGTMTPTAVKAVPTPVTVITAEQIEQQQIRNYAQLLRQFVPGLVAWENGKPDQNIMSVRGASSLSGSQLKVYVDGVQISENSYSQIDPRSIERIEIIRGPQAAAIYGSDAIGGVLEIFTKRGDPSVERLQGSIQTAWGAIQSPYRDDAALRQSYSGELRGASGNTSFNLGGGYSRDGEWVDLYHAARPSAYGGVRFEQGPFSLNLTARYYGQNYHSPFDPTLKSTGFPSVQTPTYARFRAREEGYGVQLQYRLTPSWQHQLIVGADRYSFVREDYRPQLRAPTDTLLGFLEMGLNRLSVAYRSSLTAHLSPALQAVVTAGLDYSLWRYSFFNFGGIYNLTGTIAPAPTASTFAHRDRTTNAGYFTQVQLGFRDALFLTGSARLEQNSGFGEEIGIPVSPRVGLSYVQPLGGATLKLRSAYGEAIKPPSTAQKSGSTTPRSILEPNPNLRPERQVGPEFGADLIVGSRASLGLTYYRQTAKDLLAQVDLTPIGSSTLVSRFENVGRVRNSGVELEGRLDLAGAQLTGQYAYTNSKILDPGPNYTGLERVGEQISRVPKHTAGATINLAPVRRLGVTAGMTYVGTRHEADYRQLYSCLGGTGPCNDYFESGDLRAFWARIPAFAKFNLGLDYELRPGLTSYLAVENLANSNPVEESSITIMPGRITTVGLRLRF